MVDNMQDADSPPLPVAKKKEPPQEVITVRNAKEYLGESLLIVFSVILALLLTELFNKLHESSREKEIIRQLREELVTNKTAEELQYKYQLMVLQNIDSALSHPSFAIQVLDSGRFHLKPIAPDGILKRDLSDVAWQIAKQNNAFANLDLDTYRLLNDIYEQQMRITKIEEEAARVLLSFESRKPENARTALILLSDNYHGWAADRAPGLIKSYEQAIDKLSHY
jgi:hypothetical protein